MIFARQQKLASRFSKTFCGNYENLKSAQPSSQQLHVSCGNTHTYAQICMQKMFIVSVCNSKNPRSN